MGGSDATMAGADDDDVTTFDDVTTVAVLLFTTTSGFMNVAALKYCVFINGTWPIVFINGVT